MPINFNIISLYSTKIDSDRPKRSYNKNRPPIKNKSFNKTDTYKSYEGDNDTKPKREEDILISPKTAYPPKNNDKLDNKKADQDGANKKKRWRDDDLKNIKIKSRDNNDNNDPKKNLRKGKYNKEDDQNHKQNRFTNKKWEKKEIKNIEDTLGENEVFPEKKEDPNKKVMSRTTKKLLSKNAQLDDYALYLLGCTYVKGIEVQQDYEKAFEYYSKSAELGNAYSHKNLGILYFQGKGVEKNMALSFKHFKEAADLNHLESAHVIGNFYQRGQGTPLNPLKSLEYYGRVAHANSFEYYNNERLSKIVADAQAQIGFIYFHGKGIEKNYEKAYQYLNMAEGNGNIDACKYLAQCYYEGYGCPQNREKAFALFKKSSDEERDYFSSYNVGQMYLRGIGVTANPYFAFQYLKRAAPKANPFVHVLLGEAYEKGRGVDKDLRKAFSHYKISADRGNDKSIVKVASMYQKGIGTEKSLEKAMEYYKISSDKGNKESLSMFNLLTDLTTTTTQSEVSNNNETNNSSNIQQEVSSTPEDVKDNVDNEEKENTENSQQENKVDSL